MKAPYRGGRTAGRIGMKDYKMTKKQKTLKPLNLSTLRRDMQIIMDEIDRTEGVLPDAYSPVMWQRLQNTTEKVAGAIQAVRLTLSGLSCSDVADKLALNPQQVAAYMAWNTMLQPDWVSPRVVVATTQCPKCGVAPGTSCDLTYGRLHRQRREAYKSMSGVREMQMP